MILSRPAFPRTAALVLPFVGYLVALAVALMVACWVTISRPFTGRRLVRHHDGNLAVHVWESEEPWQRFDAWAERADAGSLEGALHVRLLGWKVEVWFLDPRAATAALVTRIAARRNHFRPS